MQALIFDGSWAAADGSLGMEPAGAGCPAGSYKFDLARTTTVEPAEHEALSEAVRDYLVGAGYEVDGVDLGAGESQSTDAIVREQGISRC